MHYTTQDFIHMRIPNCLAGLYIKRMPAALHINGIHVEF